MINLLNILVTARLIPKYSPYGKRALVVDSPLGKVKNGKLLLYGVE